MSGDLEAVGNEPRVDARRSRTMVVLQIAAASLVAGLLALLAWKVLAGSPGGGFVEAIRTGEAPAAPDFGLPVIWNRNETWPPDLRAALADRRVELSELRGYPVVVNFWASWCIPCKEEAPDLAAAAEKYAGKVAFLGIDIQDFAPDAVRFMEDVDAPYVSVRDKSSASYKAYGLTGVPETFYLDAEGRAIAHSLGAVSLADLEEGIAAAIRGGAQ